MQYIDDDELPAPEYVTYESMMTALRIVDRLRALAEIESARADLDVAGGERIRHVSIPVIDFLEAMRRTMLTHDRAVALALQAADSPDWFYCNFLHEYDSKLTDAQIAELRKIKTAAVRYYKDHAQLPESVWDKLPPTKLLE